jgi:uncharacterized tellurite resistance protein B-like protein
MLDALNRKQRLNLMRFVCSFAWADLQVREEERAFVARMVDRLGLEPEEEEKVKGWLEVPPPPDAIDPITIPREHREIFLETIQGVVKADGQVAPEERENLELLTDLLTYEG